MKTIRRKCIHIHNKCNKSFRRHASTNLKQQLKFLTTLTFGPQLDKYPPTPYPVPSTHAKPQPTFGHNKFCQHGKFTLVSELTKCVEFCWPLKTRNEKLETKNSMETLPYMCRHITLAASVPLALALTVDLCASFVVIYYGQWRVKQLGSFKGQQKQHLAAKVCKQCHINTFVERIINL